MAKKTKGGKDLRKLSKSLARIDRAVQQAHAAKVAKSRGRRPARPTVPARRLAAPMTYADRAALAKAQERTEMIRAAWTTLAREGTGGAAVSRPRKGKGKRARQRAAWADLAGGEDLAVSPSWPNTSLTAWIWSFTPRPGRRHC